MGRRGDCKVCLVLVLMLVSLRPGGTSVVKEYKLQPFGCSGPDCDRIISVDQHRGTRNLYVATRKSVMELDGELNEIHVRKTDLAGDGHNVLMVLGDIKFILCQNDKNGTCDLRDVDNLDLVKKGHSNAPVVPPGGENPVGWVDKGPGGLNVLSIAVPSGDTRGGLIPLLATRKLNNGSQSPADGFLDYLEDDYSVPASYFKSGPCLGIDIEPFYGFSSGSYRYVLKTHNIKGESTEIKIARLCRGAPSYRSYAELPIECDQGTEKRSGGGVFLSTVAHFAHSYLYISLSRNASGDTLQTHVCNYSIARINDAFRQRRRECLEAKTETTELGWLSYNSCPSEPLPPSKFNYTRLDEDDFCYDLDIAHPLGGTTAIQQTPMTFLTRKDVITSLLVVTTDERPTYILGDKEGFIHKITNGSSESELVDWGHEILAVGGLMLHPEGDRVYASSVRKIIMTRLEESWTTEPPPITPTRGNPIDGNESFDMIHLSWIVPFTALIISATAVVVILVVKRNGDSSKS